MIRRNLVVLGMLLAVFASTDKLCRADLIITVGDLDLAPGGTGYVDVKIRSDAIGGDPLNNFTFKFDITTLGVTRLEFVDPQPDPQFTSPSYVFAGDSFDVAFGIPFGVVSTEVVPNDIFVGGDSTLSGDNVIVTSEVLLARLQVTALTGLAPVIGDQFTVRLVDSSSAFVDSQGPVAFSSLGGTVTIVAEAIPEPTSMVLLLLGAGTVGAFQFRSRRWLNA